MMRSSVSSPTTVVLGHRRELSTSRPICTSFSVRCSLPPLKSPPRFRASYVDAVMTLAGSLIGKRRVDESESLTLQGIRYSLIRQEDSIIFEFLHKFMSGVKQNYGEKVLGAGSRFRQ